MEKTPMSEDNSQIIYPSQQEGFVPLDFSSPIHKQGKNTQYRQQQTPYFTKNQQNRNNYYQNNRNHQNNFRNNDNGSKFGRFSESGSNNRGFYQQNNRKNFHNNRRTGGHNQQKVDVDISKYFHPSMVADPWKELCERHNAMKGDDLQDESKTETSECNSSKSFSG